MSLTYLKVLAKASDFNRKRIQTTTIFVLEEKNLSKICLDCGVKFPRGSLPPRTKVCPFCGSPLKREYRRRNG